MPVYIITYDLNKAGQNYDGLNDAIKSYPWAKVATTTYLVSTNDTSDQIRGYLSSKIDGNDKLFVAKLNGQWAGWSLPQEVVAWLNSRLN